MNITGEQFGATVRLFDIAFGGTKDAESVASFLHSWTKFPRAKFDLAHVHELNAPVRQDVLTVLSAICQNSHCAFLKNHFRAQFCELAKITKRKKLFAKNQIPNGRNLGSERNRTRRARIAILAALMASSGCTIEQLERWTAHVPTEQLQKLLNKRGAFAYISNLHCSPTALADELSERV